jgi:hypothetical protein
VRNVSVLEVPHERVPADLAALSPSAIEDMVTFFSQTLIDRYQP